MGKMTSKNNYCNLCMSCAFDCKRSRDINECENYSEMISIKELNKMIREQNVNLKRLCKSNNLKYYMMINYLKCKFPMKYKYYKILFDRLHEREEYEQYLESYSESVVFGV